MKKIILTIVFLVMVGFVIFYFSQKEKTTPEPQQTAQLSGRQCFTYHQVATVDAPYNVDEFIDINTEGVNVEGTKRGNQSGPDMTNGYTGSLSGTIGYDMLTVVYSYVVESSANKEQEEYRITNEGLAKQKYPLMEQGGMLVPDKTKAMMGELLYTPVACEDTPVEIEEVTAGLGQKILNNGIHITPIEVLSDSRCAVDVQCIWAGTVSLRAALTSGTDSKVLNLTLGTPVVFGGKNVTLTGVNPAKESTKNISSSQYKFEFSVK